MKKFSTGISIGAAVTLILLAGISAAFAALTFNGTSITGDSNSVIDATGTISIGTNSATDIRIGQLGQTVLFPGNVSSTNLFTGNATTTNLAITALGTSASNCLTVNAAGTVATTTCGGGGSGTNYWSATSTGIYYNGTGTVAAGTGLLDGNSLQVAPATVPAALAIYDMRTASATQATDITGNGNNCVFASGTNAPTLANGTLAFNGANQQYCTTSIPRSSAQTIVMAVRIPIPNSTALVPTLWSSTDNTCPALASFVPPGWQSVSYGMISSYNPSTNNTYSTAPTPGETESPIPGYAIIAVTVGSPDHWYINGLPVQGIPSISTSACTTGNLRIGANLGTVNTAIPAADYALTGDVSVFGVWNTALTAAQVASVSSAFAATNQAKNYVPAPQFPSGTAAIMNGYSAPYGYSRVHVIVDSRTWGAGGAAPYYTYLPSLLGLPVAGGVWYSDEEAEPGHSMCQMVDRIPMFAALYDPNAAHNAFIVWGVVNDHAEYAETCTAAVVKGLKEAGFDVFVGTEISASSTSGWDTYRLAYNNWLRINWKTIGAVGVIDFGANQYLGCSTCYSNTTYFSGDGIHPTALSESTIMPPIVADTMTAYYAPRVVNSAQFIPNSYQMLPGDRYINATPSATGWTITLPPCSDLTGNAPIYQIYNPSNQVLTVNGVTSPTYAVASSINAGITASFHAILLGGFTTSPYNPYCGWARTDTTQVSGIQGSQKITIQSIGATGLQFSPATNGGSPDELLGVNAAQSVVNWSLSDGGAFTTISTLKAIGLLPGTIYTAAGTPLPSCAAGIRGERATVGDATTAFTYFGAYTSGGTITWPVVCSYNSSTTNYAWLMD